MTRSIPNSAFIFVTLTVNVSNLLPDSSRIAVDNLFIAIPGSDKSDNIRTEEVLEEVSISFLVFPGKTTCTSRTHSLKFFKGSPLFTKPQCCKKVLLVSRVSIKNLKLCTVLVEKTVFEFSTLSLEFLGLQPVKFGPEAVQLAMHEHMFQPLEVLQPSKGSIFPNWSFLAGALLHFTILKFLGSMIENLNQTISFAFSMKKYMMLSNISTVTISALSYQYTGCSLLSI